MSYCYTLTSGFKSCEYAVIMQVTVQDQHAFQTCKCSSVDMSAHTCLARPYLWRYVSASKPNVCSPQVKLLRPSLRRLNIVAFKLIITPTLGYGLDCAFLTAAEWTLLLRTT